MTTVWYETYAKKVEEGEHEVDHQLKTVREMMTMLSQVDKD